MSNLLYYSILAATAIGGAEARISLLKGGDMISPEEEYWLTVFAIAFAVHAIISVAI